MKHISKHNEPKDFTEWKAQNPTATYDDLGKTAPSIKEILKDELLEEQGYLCCYCERSIETEHAHIEHFRPKAKDKFPTLQLEYENLHCSCNKFPTKTTPHICGVKKANDFSTDLISPLEEDCETHFKYHLDGTIHEAQNNDHRSSYTISLLGLNNSFLNAQRTAALQPFLDANLTVQDLEKMKKNYLTKKMDGKFNPFYTMIKDLF